MAIDAMGLSVFGDELRIMSVDMTGFTLLRCALESRFRTCTGVVALAAGHRAVDSQQREFGFGMIEAVDVHPGFHCVASFAAECGSIGALTRHAIIKLTLVRVFVASGAGAVFETERQDFVGATRGARFVAIRTRNRHVRAHESEARGLVLRDCESRAMEINDGVTWFATIVVGRGGELIVVCVFVTIGAG